MDRKPRDEEAIWLHSIKVELAQVPPLTSNWSICKVPSKLRTVNSDAYSPHLVSIGPVHHGKNNLKSMEMHKLQYAQSLFLRNGQNAIEVVDSCAKTIIDRIHTVRDYYKESLTKFRDDKELSKIMLIDGCFIMELFLRYSSPRNEFQNDPIFTTSWMISTLQRDLALLENQIPFVILEWLFNLVVRRSYVSPSLYMLPDLALGFFRSVLDINDEAISSASRRSSNHLLHLIHNSYIPTSPTTTTDDRKTKGQLDPIECARALNEAGIEFRRDRGKNMLNLTFRNGVFKIPRLVIHDLTDSLLRNLIAFEQCCRRDAQYVSSYVLLMDRLVDTSADVELLERKRIIKNNLGGCDDVSEFLNNICKEVFLEEFYFAGLCEKVNRYYNRQWHRYCAALRRDYFRNPWTVISFIAGIVLLTLTALQTVYSIMSFYPH